MAGFRDTITPKSDQLNFDDFAGGITKTITVTDARMVSGDQPIVVNYEGDNGKPFKPSKSMRRIMIWVWGDDGSKWRGRRMTLYGDPDVKFGGEKVGGIRISHMSNISEAISFPLTVTRGNKKLYTVKPLVDAPAAPVISPEEIAVLKNEATEAADKGLDALKTFWTGIGATRQKAIGGAEYLATLKKIAEALPQTENPATENTPEA